MKTLLTIGLILLVIQVHAQFEQGVILAGGNASFSRTNTDDSNNDFFSFVLAPKGAYFIMDQLAIGGMIQFSWLKPDDFDGTQIIGIGPLARYYLQQGFFGELTLSYQGGDIDGRGEVGLGVGYAAFFNKHVAVEPVLSYRSNFGNEQNRNTIGLFVGFQIYLDNLVKE